MILLSEFPDLWCRNRRGKAERGYVELEVHLRILVPNIPC